MSKLYKIRPIEKRGDPVGPPLEQLEHQERLRLLKQGKKNFDPRFGGSPVGPVFRPLKHDKRGLWERYPRGMTVFVVTLMAGSVYGPILYNWYKTNWRPLSEVEKKEAQILNSALEDRYGGTWKEKLFFKVRTE